MKKLISILRLFKRNIRVQFSNGTYIHKGANISNSSLGNFVLIGNLANVVNSKINNYTSIGRNTNIINSTIGKYCSISWNVTIGATSHPLNHISTHAFAYISFFNFTNTNKHIVTETIVGNDVWFGANSIILPGITIGNGAVIGAGTVVTKDIPNYAIVVGSPAKIVNYRFDEDVIKELERLEWWNLSGGKIKENLDLWKKELNSDVLSKLNLIKNK